MEKGGGIGCQRNTTVPRRRCAKDARPLEEWGVVPLADRKPDEQPDATILAMESASPATATRSHI